MIVEIATHFVQAWKDIFAIPKKWKHIFATLQSIFLDGSKERQRIRLNIGHNEIAPIEFVRLRTCLAFLTKNKLDREIALDLYFQFPNNFRRFLLALVRIVISSVSIPYFYIKGV